VHLHVFDVVSHVHGKEQVQVPAEPVALHTKFVIVVSQSIEGDAAELHVAFP
jgi:hypothetical protein